MNLEGGGRGVCDVAEGERVVDAVELDGIGEDEVPAAPMSARERRRRGVDAGACATRSGRKTGEILGWDGVGWGCLLLFGFEAPAAAGFRD